jgi:hypothetical protein
MRAIVFCGPTIPEREVLRHADVEVRPPAAQGDVYGAARSRPRAIGIIDGYFDRVPAVWHKEILWALSEGIHVFGAASMGALRAAELADHGVIGVGRIFREFLEGTLEDDDEVAIAHLPADRQFKPTSEAMVNIRATLAAACSAGVIGESTRSILTALGKGLFFPERCYPRILELGAARADVPAAETAAFSAWLPDNRVDLKRADAVELLQAMDLCLRERWPPPQVDFLFESTNAWEAAKLRADQRPQRRTSGRAASRRGARS